MGKGFLEAGVWKGCHERGRHKGTPLLWSTSRQYATYWIFSLVSLFYTSRLSSHAINKANQRELWIINTCNCNRIYPVVDPETWSGEKYEA